MSPTSSVVAFLKQVRRLWRGNLLGSVLRRGAKRGRCPICVRPTLYFATADGLVHCLLCYGITRRRALIHVLENRFPDWRELRIHEASPAGAATEKLRREGRHVVFSLYWPDVPTGTHHRGYRCEDLEKLTFPDEAFDLTITQDVFEHVFDPGRAFAEIARTLAPGGAHVFTIPYNAETLTTTRAVRVADGVRHERPPVYHDDPQDPLGSLVVTDWGRDLPEFIARNGGLATEVVTLRGLPGLGIGESPAYVFISRKGRVAPGAK